MTIRKIINGIHILVVVLLFVSATAVEYSRIAEGYPQGLIPYCPGSSKPAIVTPKSLKKVVIYVVGKNGSYSGKYDYFNMDNLAKNPDIDFKKKTYLYVPGYLDFTYHSGRNLGRIYRRYGYNALVLDILQISAMVYPQAARLMRAIGKNVAEMLVALKPHGLDPKKLEIVGISLGAHAMGFIAKNYRQMTGQNISSLTALDPAGPCFRYNEPDQRLDKSDGDFVKSIVTNMDDGGISIPVGHINFYVNGGEYQFGPYLWLPCSFACSHFRVFFLWWSALLYPGTFIGVKCDDLQKARDADCYDVPVVSNTMDLYTDRSKTGIYYIRTSGRWPYFLGKRGLRKPRKINGRV